MAVASSAEAPAAPATVTDSPSSRRFNIQISPAVLLLLPVGALALYLCVSLLSVSPPGSQRPVEALPAATETAAPARAPAQTEADLAENGEAAEAEPLMELPSADLERLRERAQRSAQQAQQLSDARGRVKIQVYRTERCQNCIEVHGYLVAHGIQAVEHDIDKDPRARARYRRLNPKGSLPTIDVDGQVLAGFDARRLERSLDRAALARIRRGR
ncbi:MAG: glutaredoxin domain-containing protein [Deltaproteobacteria bacterium]